MQIALIEPRSPGLNVFKKFVLPRLGLPILAAILRDMGHTVKVFCEDLARINWSYVDACDLVGISTITCTAERAYEIARKIKDENPNKPVIMGGPHVTFLPHEALENGVDIVVRGEGEIVIVEIIEWLENRRALDEISGISYKVAGKRIDNPNRERDQDIFDHIPFPALDLIEGLDRLRFIPIQTSRGCHKRCEFCSVTPMFGRKLRCASVESVVAEVERLITLLPGRSIFFYDDNFVGKPKRTKELLRSLIEMRKRTGAGFNWFAQVTVNSAKDIELMALMRDAGCNQVYVGIESVNPETLKEWKKDQTVEEIRNSIKVFHKHGIAVHGMFILGGDHDDLKTIKDTVRFAINMRIDTVMFSILTPLPGAETYQKLEEAGRLLSRSWRYYDSHHVVFEPAKIPAWQLQKAVMLQAMPRFYSWGRVIKRALLSLLPPYGRKSQRLRNFFLTIYGHLSLRKFRRQKEERKFFRWLKELPARLKRKKDEETSAS
ncbi:MAG TPA: radical SAM protein [Candidatus Bipolaricaulota bacterium]|nr:radical SAM protein [Candidatus Bipolaricaulota bacterium]